MSEIALILDSTEFYGITIKLRLRKSGEFFRNTNLCSSAQELLEITYDGAGVDGLWSVVITPPVMSRYIRICLLERSPGVVEMVHCTPSEHGGVVKEPSNVQGSGNSVTNPMMSLILIMFVPR